MRITIQKEPAIIPPPAPISKQEEPKAKRPMGRQKGAHLKQLNMEQFITDHNCVAVFMEHPWITDVTLYENKLIRDTLAKTEHKTKDIHKWSIHLSTKLLDNTAELQREAFIKCLCNLIAIKLFDDAKEGPAFKLLVERYSRKQKKIKFVADGEPITLDYNKITVKH